MQNNLYKKNYLLVWGVLFAVGLLKLWIGLNLPLQSDEAYWWALSRQLDFSYFDQGPMTPFFIWISTSLLGNTLLALKLTAVVLTTFANFLVFQITRELGLSLEKAWIALGLSVIIPGFFLGSFIIVHDSTFIPLWVGALYCAVRFLKREERIFLIGFFVCLGLGALSKHIMILFVFGVLLWILITPEKWNLFRMPSLYGGIFLTFLIILPMLVWNYGRDWIGFEMLFGMKYAGGVKKQNDPITYIVGQLLGFSPILYVLFWLLPFRSGWKKFYNNWSIPVWKFVYINALVLPISFFVFSFKTTIQGNWVFASYPAMLILLTANLPDLSKRYTTFIWGAICSLPAILSILVVLFYSEVNAIFPIEERFKLVQKNFGYENAILEIEKFRIRTDPTAKLIANTYQDAARASWYLADNPYIPSLNLFKRNQYTLWKQPKAGENYVVFHVSDNPCVEPDFLILYLNFACSQVVEHPIKEIIKNGKVLKRYQMWYCKNLEEHWSEYFVNQRYEESLNKLLADQSKLTQIGKKNVISPEIVSRLLLKLNSPSCRK